MAQEPQNAIPSVVPWYYSRSGVFILIFLVAGALAAPLLWRSTAFSTKEKMIWSLVAILYTALVIALIIWMALFIWRLWTTFAEGSLEIGAAPNLYRILVE
jgi:hypothetical protein